MTWHEHRDNLWWIRGDNRFTTWWMTWRPPGHYVVDDVATAGSIEPFIRAGAAVYGGGPRLRLSGGDGGGAAAALTAFSVVS